MRLLRLVLLIVMGAVAACATTGSAWVTEPGYDDTADAQRVRDRISELRFHENRGPALPYQVAQLHLEQARKRIAEGRDPEAALEHGVEASVDEGERSIHYWHLEVDRLEDFKVPSLLLAPSQLNIAIAVVRRAPELHPRYMVLMATSSAAEYNRQERF